MLVLLTISIVSLATNVKPAKSEWTGTVYIRADGSIDPPDAPIQRDGDVYTLTGNITSDTDGIIIEKDNVIIYGNGYTLNGNETGRGFSLCGRSNITVMNINIKGFWVGIYVLSSSDIILAGNKVTENYACGVSVTNCEHVNLSGNQVIDNWNWESFSYALAGILFNRTQKSEVINNTIQNNVHGVRLILSSDNNISENILGYNWLSGNLLLEDSNNNTISKNYAEYSTGIRAENSSYNTISENTFIEGGIWITEHSDNNFLLGNNISESRNGIYLSESTNNTLSENLLSKNEYNLGVFPSMYYPRLSDFIHSIDTSNLVDGNPVYYLINHEKLQINPATYPFIGYLALINCTNIEIKNLDLTNNREGLLLAYTKNCTIMNNNITHNEFGVYTVSSSNTTFSENNITANGVGVSLFHSSRSCILANNLSKNGGNGIQMLRSSNNTLTENNIMANEDSGIIMLMGDYNTISENNLINNHGGIIFSGCDYNSISGNNIARDSFIGISLHTCFNNSVFQNRLKDNYLGIGLQESYGNTLRGNIMINNTESFGVWSDRDLSYFVNDVDVSNTIDGRPIYYWINKHDSSIPSNAGYVGLINCTNMLIAKLNLKNNHQGILLAYTTNSTLRGNHIENNRFGILIAYSSNITVYCNNVKNSTYGVVLQKSKDNRIFTNNVQDNHYGISIKYSSNNLIYHNNFLRNTMQVWLYSSYNNTWDNCYPSGGNFWSDYIGVDTNGDGVGDLPHVIDEDNVDNYPLMGQLSSFNTTLGYSIAVVSNSTIEDFRYFESNSTIVMHVSNMTANQTVGFCRLTIHHDVMSPPYTVKVNGTTIECRTIYENYTEGISIIYFAYEHSKLEITIIPEFPTAIILPLFMVLNLVAFVFRKKRGMKNQKCGG